MNAQLVHPLRAVVMLCAIAGFLIVWFVFPAKKTKPSFSRDQTTTAGASNSLPPEDELERERPNEDPPRVHSYSDQRPRWCDILLLEPDASPAAIRKAYARLMKGLHPDSAGADQNTSRQCALVQDAYQQAMNDRRAEP